MSAPGFVLRGRRVLVDGALRPADVAVADGRVAGVLAMGGAPAGTLVVDAGERVVMPGLVDAHVHVNEPGRTEWEGYASATAAAAAGGVTTLVDMPLNGLPPATRPEAVTLRRAAIEGVARVDVALWGGLVPGGAAPEALAAAGVAGLKCFLCPSGVDEFPPVGAAELDRALPVLRRLGLPLLAHAEAPEVLARHADAPGDPHDYARFLATRPPAAEAEAVRVLARLARRHHARVHVVHVSSREALAVIAEARAAGVPLTAETCPHYLSFAAGEIGRGATEFQCAPPIRDAEHREALWGALADGTLDLVATDHSPCPPAMKARGGGAFGAAWGGIASLQFLLAATWTGAAARGHGLAALARWTAEAPAALAGLGARKGRIAPGFDADLVVWDDADTFTVTPELVRHRHPLTPYTGRRLRGVVHQTWVRGTLAYDRATGLADRPGGRWLDAGRARRPAARPAGETST